MKKNSKVTVVKEETKLVLEAGDVLIKEGKGRYTIIEADDADEDKDKEKDKGMEEEEGDEDEDEKNKD